MDISAEIGNSDSIKPTEPRQRPNYNYYQPAPKKSKPTKNLRKGEIVFGTVVKSLSDKDAIVNLPSGTFAAVLKGSLRAGDSLYLMVQEIEPSLILRIYAVSHVIDGKELRNSEILRLLNLPDTSFYHELTDIIRTHKALVVRDDILLIYKAFLEIEDSLMKGLQPRDILQMLFDMLETSVPLTPEEFSSFYPLLTHGRQMSSIIKGFERLINTAPVNIRQEFARLLSNIRDSANKGELRIDLLSFNPLDRGSVPLLYKLVKDIIATKSSYKIRPDDELLNLCLNFTDVIESQRRWNFHSLKNKGEFLLYYPDIARNDLNILTITIRRLGLKSKSGGKEEADEAVRQVLESIGPSNEMANLRAAFPEKLKNWLKSIINDNLAIKSINFEDGSEIALDVNPNQPPPPKMEKFSVVI